MSIKTNTTDLQALLEVANNLPEAITPETPIISVSSSGLITASANDLSATKQLTTQAAKTVTPTTSNQTAVASGVYTTGAVTVKGDSNLVAGNIVKGKSIFGVTGTAPTIDGVTATLPMGRMKGDVDGDGKITAEDHELLSDYLANLIEFDEIQKWCSDVTGDNTLNAVGDVLNLQRYVSGQENALTGIPRMADYYSNWTWMKVDDTSGYFYYDVPATDSTSASTASLSVSAYADCFIGVECMDGVVRVKAERLPLEDVECCIVVGMDGVLEGALFLEEGNTITASMPSSDDWWEVTYGNGKFVAVASNSTKAAYSTDGITWNATTLPIYGGWGAVTYGNGKFVAISCSSDSTKAAYSTDGITWNATTLPSSAYWYSVTYGNGKFVAVAYGNNIAAYSGDGITWTDTNLPVSDDWYSVTYGNGKFVAVTCGNNIAAYSEDGITWNQNTLPKTADWESVTYGNGKFVAVTYSNSRAAYSTDGITWNDATLPSPDWWESVTYGDGKFVAIADSSNKAAYSTDGITWVETTLPSDECWHAVTYGNGKFVAVAYESNKVIYSEDGITWTNQFIPILINNTSGTDVTEETIQKVMPLDTELSTQDDLIAQIASALEGKTAGGGGGGSVKKVNATWNWNSTEYVFQGSTGVSCSADIIYTSINGTSSSSYIKQYPYMIVNNQNGFGFGIYRPSDNTFNFCCLYGQITLPTNGSIDVILQDCI